MVKNIIFYTDGSSTVFPDKKKLKYGGIGVFVSKYSKYNVSRGLVGPKVTNQICELQACIDALKISKEIINNNKRIKNLNIIIYSDSMYTIKSVTEWCIKWKKNNWKKSDNKKISNLELIKELYSLTNELEVKYIHVRSHQKEPSDKNSKEWVIWNGNDNADKLASKAMNKLKNSFK